MPGGKHVLGQGKNRIFGTAKVGDRGQIVIPQEDFTASLRETPC